MNKNNNNNNNNNKNNSNVYIYSNRKKSNKNIIKINSIYIYLSFINNHVQNLRWATYSENGIRCARSTSPYEKFYIYIYIYIHIYIYISWARAQ